MSHTLSRYSRLSKCTPIFLIGGLLLVQIIWSPLPSSLSSSDVYAGGGGFNCATATNINVPVQECYQIQAFYSANGGSNWTNKTNRDTDTNICTWYGVGCTNMSGQDTITSLSLANNGFVGSSLSYLTVLTGFTYIDLSDNQLNTSLDGTWGSLVNLTGLNLSNTQIYGTLPSGWSTLTNLTNLDLSNNKLYGSVPGSWTAGLTDRQSIYIDLTNNCITTTGYTTPEQSWLTANVTMSPQNICLIYTINTNEGTFSGASSASVVQTVTSGASGTPVQVLPKPSYTFSQWSDGSTANPRTDTNVTGTITVSAQFTTSFTLTYMLGTTNGLLSGTNGQTVASGGSGSPIEAISTVSGYDFLRWSDGRTDNPRIDTGVTANLTVSAVWRASCATMANIDVPLAECEALVDLYLATDGDSWTTNTNRYTDSNICTWYGVSCSLFGFQKKVTSITLPNNNLVGTLPSSLSGLTELTYFAVNNNSLIGSIPSSVISNRQNIGTPYIIASYNCLQTLYTPGEQVFLNLNASLSPQNVCNDTSITQSVVSLGPISLGSAIRYMISYTNNGPDIATGAMIKLYPGSGLSIQSGSISYTEIRTGVNYMTLADVCYSQMMTATTGLYVDDLNAYALTLGAPDMKTLLENNAGYTGDDNRGAFFLSWRNANNPPSQSFSSWYFSYLLGVLYGSNDIASIHPTCGDAGTFDHYRFLLGDLPSGATGSFTLDALVTGIVVGQTGVTNLMTIESTTGTDYDTGNNISSLTTSFGYSVSYLTGIGGSISGTALQTVTVGSDASTVTAIPDSAYSFSGWSDGYTGATRTDTTIVADTIFTAYFTLTPVVVVVTPSLGGGGGGGGGGGLQADVCTSGDRSPSYYDGSCGTMISTGTVNSVATGTQVRIEQAHTGAVVQNLDRCVGRSVSRQIQCFVRESRGFYLTKLSRMIDDVVVTRGILAGVISEFATTVMHQTPDTQKKCLFTDTRNRAMRQVCQLHLMGIEQDHTPLALFAPDEIVTKQQFITIIGRMIYGGRGDVDSYATRLFADKIISSKRLTGGVTKDFVLRALYKIAQKK